MSVDYHGDGFHEDGTLTDSAALFRGQFRLRKKRVCIGENQGDAARKSNQAAGED
jgi:hypothetical protein